ncbi:MAG TPA: cytochrome c [Cyclobacteriaceae bacterium]|jgi:mono/diheme cytochrome c family protein|nr:cytochrome c [Cyclobacteriaceae bacterium]
MKKTIGLSTMKLQLFFILFLFTLVLCSFYQVFDLKASMERGKTIYEAQCMSCHMAEGEGLEGIFPPLAKTDYLNDKNRLIKVTVLGVRGPMKINGVDYNGEMTSFDLNNEQVSDVLNYIRNSWGNKGVPILPAEIQPALKASTKDYRPY